MTIPEARAELERFVKLKTTLRPKFVDVLLNVCPVTCGECRYGTQLFPGRITCTSVMMDQDNMPTDYCSFGRRKDE